MSSYIIHMKADLPPWNEICMKYSVKLSTVLASRLCDWLLVIETVLICNVNSYARDRMWNWWNSNNQVSIYSSNYHNNIVENSSISDSKDNSTKKTNPTNNHPHPKIWKTTIPITSIKHDSCKDFYPLIFVFSIPFFFICWNSSDTIAQIENLSCIHSHMMFLLDKR